jgi:outer membrane biosynthesis protein TonB
MKQETNNEMDLLLRRLARRDDAVGPDADHLDADELNGYAENVLPAAARARYTAHLAECSRCRELIVQLSASAGVVVATESATVAGPSGWKKFLASLFTPMVLRYAAPALGLIVVAAIGFVILRSNQPARNVAQVTNSERPAALPSTQSEGSIQYSLKNPSPSPDELRDKPSRGLQAESAPVQNAAPVVSSGERDLAKDEAAAQPKPEQQTTAANEPPPAPKVSATPAPEESPRATETEVSKKEYREQPAAAPAAGKTLRAAEQREGKDKVARARKPAESVTTTQGAGSVADERRGSFGLVGEARTVAGRRFRNQSGVWIDTAYDASKEVVTVRRGSEQYRGLVADEPALKTIADTLDGEIIVVWKGHTYRIR